VACTSADYPKAMADFKAAGLLSHSVELRQVKYLNSLVEQDHRFYLKTFLTSACSALHHVILVKKHYFFLTVRLLAYDLMKPLGSRGSKTIHVWKHENPRSAPRRDRSIPRLDAACTEVQAPVRHPPPETLDYL